MTTYNLAVYSALYGPITIEKADSKEDLLKKMVDYIKKYWPNAIEPFIKILNPNIQYPVVDADSFVSTTTLKNHSSSSNSIKTHQKQISNSYIGIVKTAKNS